MTLIHVMQNVSIPCGKSSHYTRCRTHLEIHPHLKSVLTPIYPSPQTRPTHQNQIGWMPWHFECFVSILAICIHMAIACSHLRLELSQ